MIHENNPYFQDVSMRIGILFGLQQTQQIIDHANIVCGQIFGGYTEDVLVQWQFGWGCSEDR